MPRPNLTVVGPDSSPPAATASPEGMLRSLFRKEARLERQLLEARQGIQAERRRYAEKHRLGCFPAIEQLRRLFK